MTLRCGVTCVGLAGQFSPASVGHFGGLELRDACGRVHLASSIVDMVVVMYLDDHGASSGADA